VRDSRIKRARWLSLLIRLRAGGGGSHLLESDFTLLGSSAMEGLSTSSELSAGLQLSLSVLSVLLLLSSSTGLGSLCVRIQLKHDILILERISLLGEDNRGVLEGGLHNRLDFIRIDDTGKVSVGHSTVRKMETFLQLGTSIIGSEERVELVKSTLGPDAESAEVSTRSELEEVEVVNRCHFNTREVSESLVESLRLVVDHKRTTSLSVSAVSCLANTTLKFAGLLGLLDIGEGTKSLQDDLGVLGAVDFVECVIKNQRHLRDLVNTVSTSHDEGRDSGGSKS
jgi:hypothetical protein